MKNIKRKYAIVMIACLLISTLFAQNYKFDHLTANDGLGDDYVRRIFCDSYGFVWIGTKDGLSRFDGYDLKTYKNTNNPEGMVSAFIGDIEEDANGNLWIATGNGLEFYDRETERFKNYNLGNSKSNKIFRIEIDSNLIWVATQDGLIKFSPETTEYIRYFTHTHSMGIDSNFTRINSVQRDKFGYLWLGFSANNGLIKFNPQTEEYIQFSNTTNPASTFPGSNISGLDMINDSILFVASIGYGAVIFNLNTETWKLIDNEHLQREKGVDMPWSMYQDATGNVWMGSINDGLFLFDKSFHFIKNIFPEESDFNGLNSPSISTITGDKHGNLWFGTHSGGVNIIYKRKNLFKQYRKKSGKTNLDNNFISCFYESSPGKIWVGTDGGGLNLFDRTTNEFRAFTTKNGLSSNSILSINSYDKDRIVLATWDGGVTLFNITDYSSSHLLHDDRNPNSISYKYLKYAVRRGDSLYIVTHSHGLNIYDIKNKLFHHALNQPNLSYLAMPETANKALFDENGNLWIPATGGLYRLKDGTMYEYLPDSAGENSINDKYITDVFVDSQSRVWFATLNGLNLYNEKNDAFIRFENHEELKRAIMSICEDDNHNLWFGTNTGLVKFNYNDDEVTLFDKTDGLQGNQFFERSAFKDSEGNLYFGGMNGFNTFHPSQMYQDTAVPVIFFNDFKIFYKSQIPSETSSVLKKTINFTEEITLEYSQKVISFHFTALQMYASSKNRYMYILEGFDKDWYDVGNHRSATYTNLSPGNYTFRVKACNADNVWTRESKDIKIHILSPWWLTWWFRIIIVAAVSSLLFIIYSVRTRNITRRNRLLEEKVEIRTLELRDSNEQLKHHKEELLANNKKLEESVKTKDRFFSIIAHDLKSPMSTLLGFSDLLLKRWESFSEEKKHGIIKVINSSSNILFALLDNLLEWSRSQTDSMDVEIREMKLLPFINESVLLLKSELDEKQIKVINDIDENALIRADKNMFDTVVRNILSNAIKFTQKGGGVTISSGKSDAETHELVIEDSGVGMTQVQIDSLFKVDVNIATLGTEDEKGTGLGLLVCYEFMQKMGGSISVESEIGRGTSFTLRLPKGGN